MHPSQLGVPAPALFPILSSPSRVEASVNHLFKIPSLSVALDQHQARSCASRVKLFPPLIIGIIFVSCLVAPFLFSIAERLPPGHGSWLQLLSALQDLFSCSCTFSYYFVTRLHLQLPLTEFATPFALIKAVGGGRVKLSGPQWPFLLSLTHQALSVYSVHILF